MTGNLLLDRLCGATVHWCAREDRAAHMEAVAAEVRARGGVPYVIPLGGSTGLGALGYVRGVIEALAQLAARGEAVDTMVCARMPGARKPGWCWERRWPAIAGGSWGSASMHLSRADMSN